MSQTLSSCFMFKWLTIKHFTYKKIQTSMSPTPTLNTRKYDYCSTFDLELSLFLKNWNRTVAIQRPPPPCHAPLYPKRQPLPCVRVSFLPKSQTAETLNFSINAGCTIHKSRTYFFPTIKCSKSALGLNSFMDTHGILNQLSEPRENSSQDKARL